MLIATAGAAFNPYDFVLDFIFKTLFTYQMAGIVLLVIVVMEVIKRTYFNSKGKEINGNWLPWIALAVCAIASLLVQDFSFSKKFVYDLLLSISVSDLAYTFGIRKLVRLILKYKTGGVDVNNK